MAQTGFTPIQLYSSSTPTNAPSAGNLTNDTKGSELAINIADKNLFFKDSTGVVNTVPIRQSGASSNGWLSSTDWNTFNNKQPAGTYVTSVGATAPVASSGGTTPTISMPAASTSVSGYLTNTDWNTFNNKANAFTYTTNYIPYGQGTATPAQSAGLQYNGTTFTTTGISTSNNLAFTGTGNRITGDFSNATVANRVSLQTSTANGNTVFQMLPNGTSALSVLLACNNSDPTNAARARLGVNATAASIESDISGTGTYLPLLIATGGNEAIRVHVSRGVSIGNTTDPGATNLSVTGYTKTGKVNTDEGTSGSIANGATANIITLPAVGVYLVTARQDGASNGGIRAAAIVAQGSSTNGLTSLAAVGGATLVSGSGFGVDLTNTAGGALTVRWSYTKLSS